MRQAPTTWSPTAAAKPYVLLRDSLEKTDRLAVVKVALRQREPLAMLRVARRACIVLQTLLWPDEVRARRSRSSTRTSTCARRS